jgi:hypothetical protein
VGDNGDVRLLGRKTTRAIERLQDPEWSEQPPHRPLRVSCYEEAFNSGFLRGGRPPEAGTCLADDLGDRAVEPLDLLLRDDHKLGICLRQVRERNLPSRLTSAKDLLHLRQANRHR